MPNQMDEQDLKDRLSLIESMIAEGRRTTAHWSWICVLWGVAYFAAMAWTTWGPNKVWAWPVCVAAALIVMAVFITGTRGRGGQEKHPETTMGRAIGSVWMGLGISMVLLFPSLGISGRLGDVHVFIAIVASFLGLANGACGLMLRWKAQIACAALWWATSVASLFGTENQAVIIFLVAIFLCLIVFGFYGMVLEARERRQRGAVHA
jgi:hypothetical protein